MGISINAGAVHLGNAFHEDFLDAGFTAPALVIERHQFVTDRRLHARDARHHRDKEHFANAAMVIGIFSTEVTAGPRFEAAVTVPL